jgi:hypothetical protein
LTGFLENCPEKEGGNNTPDVWRRRAGPDGIKEEKYQKESNVNGREQRRVQVYVPDREKGQPEGATQKNGARLTAPSIKRMTSGTTREPRFRESDPRVEGRKHLEKMIGKNKKVAGQVCGSRRN